jgi:MFS family permease
LRTAEFLRSFVTVNKQGVILPAIVLAQFAGTSLWFAVNAVIPELQSKFQLGSDAISVLISAVQFGFITGTLVFSIVSIADRFSPTLVFLVSSILASAANLAIIYIVDDKAALVSCRFLTGFFLAGIYPVGMKIAADWFENSLGKALGYLVGALVLGTAFPFLLKALQLELNWKDVLHTTSIIAIAGGCIIYVFVGNGPFRKKSNSFKIYNMLKSFRSRDFSSAALGYFGHMWELYAWWAFVPIIISIYGNHLNVPLWSFVIIASGAAGSIIGGYASRAWGNAKVAFASLLVSCLCCLLLPLAIYLPPLFFFTFMITWGIFVVADSPQFSALVARMAAPEFKGTALTSVTCIGFAITILSTRLIDHLIPRTGIGIFSLLAIGPFIGLVFLFQLAKRRS